MPTPQQVSISDFRPGIVDNFRYGNALAGTLDMPIGSAQAGTVRCFADETGSLSPLPGRNTALDQVFVASAHMSQVSTMRPIGLFTFGPLITQNGFISTQNANFADELHVMFEGKVAASAFHGFEWHVRKLYFPAIPADVIVNGDGFVNSAPAALDFHGISACIARVSHTAPFDVPGLPVFIMEWSEAPNTAGGGAVIAVYPNTATTLDPPVIFGSNAAIVPALTGGAEVQLVAHAGRVVELTYVYNQHGAAGSFTISNENMFFTDPPGADAVPGTIGTVLDPDRYDGFGSWGSLAYGELLLVKRIAGGVVLNGDIYAPQVSVLRGVKGTGKLVNQGSIVPVGMVYCVENDGAYLWEGGQSSQKISKVADRFYDRAAGNPDGGVQVKHTAWGRFVVFPNMWVWDSLTDSWWQMESDPAYNAGLVEAGKGNANLLYAAPDQFVTPATCTIRVFDTNKPWSSYIWIGQPLPVAHVRIDVTDIEVCVSNIIAGATVTVEMMAQGVVVGTPTVFTFASASNGPLRLLAPNLGYVNLYDVQPKITVDSHNANNPAPTLDSITFTYLETTPFSQTGA